MLDDLTAVVTGGASGIGRGIAVEFARQGADVIVADVQQHSPHYDTDTVELIEEAGSTGAFVETDVSDPDSVAGLFEEVDETFGGRLDALVNNAGVHSYDGEVRTLDYEDWQTTIDVNLTGAFLCSKHAIPHFLAAGEGSIINISSVAGFLGSPDVPAYCASKGGIMNLTRQLAVQYGSDGIRANSIHPGFVDTPMTEKMQQSEKGERMLDRIPLDRISTPEDIADVAVFLASDISGYVTGHPLVVDGGLTAHYL